MYIHTTWESSRTPGPDARFNCPACGEDVPARTYALKEIIGVFFIPLITQRETYVECSGCGLYRLTRLPLEELSGYSADELTPHLYRRVSIIVWTLAFASVLGFCLPVIGLAFGALGLLMSWRTGGWPKRLSMVGLALSSVVTAIFVGYLLFGK
jgi:hypothetical protein